MRDTPVGGELSTIAHISIKASARGATGEKRHTRSAWVLRCVYRYVPIQLLQDRRRLFCVRLSPRDVNVVAVSFGVSCQG